jgi:signal transduction histidine kinase
MILDLLDLTRIESGRKERTVTRVSLLDVLSAALETFAPEAEKRGIAIRCANEEPVELDTDRGELEIILNNLISNAVKYNRDGGTVTVSYGVADGIVTVRVADTGIGMKAEDAKKLFQDFVRIRNAKTKSILGSGLGLSIVKKLAALNGGAVSVESEPEVGSTFTVTLAEHAEAAEA